jgi:hypothetical protein
LFHPSLIRQEETLHNDDPWIYAVYCCDAASTIITMEENHTAASIRSRKEAGADPVALRLTKHCYEEIAKNESFTSDEEDSHPACPQERLLSVDPNKICTRLMICMDSYIISDLTLLFRLTMLTDLLCQQSLPMPYTSMSSSRGRFRQSLHALPANTTTSRQGIAR